MAQNDVVDILLIGSGGSGGPFTWYLSQVEGITIVCLEQGDWAGTGGPMATIQANALRIADYFKNNVRRLLTM